MAIASSPQPTLFEENSLHRERLNLSTGGHRVRNWLLVSAVALLGILVAGFALVMQNWPFTRAQIEKDLAHATVSTVAISRIPPLLTVQKLTIQGSFLGLRTKHVPVSRRRGYWVVEDDATVRYTFSKVLEAEGYDVSTANDGFDALLHLQQEVPD